jgi:PhnB protein
MSLAPYLFFPGTCEAAFAAYADVLGGTDLQIMRFSDLPPGEEGPPPGTPGVMHASILIGGQMLMGSDYPPGVPFPGQAGSAVHLIRPDAEAAGATFAALAEGGEVTMPFAATFWAAGFGMLRDRWGVSWMISTPG